MLGNKKSFENDVSKNVSERNEAEINRIQEVPIAEVDEFVQRILGIRKIKEEKPSQERIDRIKRNLESAADIMNQSEVEYQLDGAINILLYNNEFFRDHRDIDFSIFSKDIIKLTETFEKNGYALFRFPPSVDEEIEKRKILPHELLRVKDIDVSKVGRQLLFFVKVKENFAINKEKYDPIDIHCLDQDEEGNIMRANGNIMPKKYYENRPEYELKPGERIKLSNPIILAYNKLFQGRSHDLNDVEYMIEKQMLTKEDLQEIDKLLEGDEEKSWQEELETIKKSRKWLHGKLK